MIIYSLCHASQLSSECNEFIIDSTEASLQDINICGDVHDDVADSEL